MSRSEAFAKTGRAAVQQNIQGTLEFLQKYPPFNQMELAHLSFLVENCQLRFYAEGEKVVCPEDGLVEFFYIVKQGTIYGERRQGQDSSKETTFEITTGECFPIAALLGERATRTSHIAAVDTFCLLLDKAAFVKIFTKSNPFRDFSLRGISSLLDQANQQVQSRAAETLGSQLSLETKLAELLMREPVTCQGDLPLHKAVQLMHEQQISSVMIADEMQRLQGIFTLRDLRRVIADANADLRQPISEFMTPNPFHLSPQASAFDAALAMTERHFTHVCLVEDGRLVGMISERDLFSLQRVDLVHLARAVRNAVSVESLAQLREDIRSLVDRMIAHGASPEQVTRLITLLNDHTVSRVIELCMEQHGDPGVEFTWLVFGSEGRKEQTLYTDQDNGILFEASSQEEANAIRQKLLPLAREINLALDDCGFTLCKGNIMAGNAELCLSREEWTRRFSKIVREATAENLLYSTIFFDLRAIWGPLEGCQILRREMLALIRSNDVFQRLLAQASLQHKPPLGGLFRDFSLDKKGAEKDTLDLKIKGLTPFVDGARVLALSHGIESSNTLERFRQLVSKGVIERLDGDAYAEAYHFIQLIRMQQHQQQARNELAYSNRIYPDELNHLDRRILREAFRQAQRLQASIAFRYQL
ncbi:CBS domain-containing protein [Pseudomonas sp. C27(2019)]|uniref:putative nucleotidyltransferase substrate binding domain-containing protein n=1 Tax=Pseudomonas sp. C27(2019) TaxID=2604941 RepID=UPI0012488AE5|nr:putative nucleotidyltransferase substrate binding domain-containing protein [Pseudomonas sp. C27(2019)]QEY57708.1 CBS domain-containing protein [Pseudomonas sp. C27(2019)]